jgi:hypothetical protein
MVAVGAVLAAIIVAFAIPGFRMRAEAVALVLTGRIRDLGVADLLAMMRPGSGQLQLGRLIDTRNPYPVIRIPPLTAAEKTAGMKLLTNNALAATRLTDWEDPGHPHSSDARCRVARRRGPSIGPSTMASPEPECRRIRCHADSSGSWSRT